jgi:hexosaminidase
VNNGPEQIYVAPIKLDSTMVVGSQVVKNGEQKGRITTDSIVVHKGVRAAISLNSQPHPAYNAGGTGALNNGRFGSSNRFGDSEWLGFWGDDLEIVISFDDPVSALSVQTRFFHAPGQWVYTPEKAILNAELSDGSVFNLTTFPSPNGNGPVHCDFDLSPLRSKFNGSVLIEKLRISIPNYGVIPKGRQGAGQKAWTFVDEIVIDQ